MKKYLPKRFQLLSRGKKIIFCLLALALVLSLTVLIYSNQNSSQTRRPKVTLASTVKPKLTASPYKGRQVQPSGTALSSADVAVDFGSRQNKGYPIPSRFLGIGGINIGIALNHAGSYVPQAGFHLTKLGDYNYLAAIFPTAASLTDPSQQNWSLLDSQMTLTASYDLQPIITIGYTPPWLQPQNQNPPLTNPCLTYNPAYNSQSVKPMYIVNGQDSGIQVWAQLAALVVAHVDQKFPNSHASYEIWNQPDAATALCEANGDSNADQDRYNDYRAMFAAAAPAMKQQASKDGIAIKIGGPALVYAMQKHLSLWLPNLLSDPSIYPYMDFVTYHRYMYGSSFSTSTDPTSFVANAQDPNLGVIAEYEQVSKIVHAGKQPNAASTPIYIDEYNMNPCTRPIVCRNDPTYAPLTNALFLVDLLNTANDVNSRYGHVPAIPAGLAFYTWYIPQQNLCMFGILDTQLDCGPKGDWSTLQPYPQYYTYQLFGGSAYLDMTNNGYVANSVTINPAGVYATGFYTASLDNLVLVNTTSTDYPTLNVLVQNPGVPSLQANVYTVAFNMSNPASTISTQQVNLIPGAGGYTATIHLPPYRLVALSFTAL